MSYLIDTHILIWALTNTSKLSNRARLILSECEGRFFFSPASVWEVAIKRKKHPDQLPLSAAEFRTMLREAGFHELRITAAHTAVTETLPEIHGDPFDRLLVAQSKVESIPLVTHDGKLSPYGDNIISV